MIKHNYFKTNATFDLTTTGSNDISIIEDTGKLVTHNKLYQFVTDDFKKELDDNELVIASALNDLNLRIEENNQGINTLNSELEELKLKSPIIVRINVYQDDAHFQNNESYHTYSLAVKNNISLFWGTAGNYIDGTAIKEIIENSINLSDTYNLPPIKFVIYRKGTIDEVVIVFPSVNIHPYQNLLLESGITLRCEYKDPSLGVNVCVAISSVIDNNVITLTSNANYIVGD